MVRTGVTFSLASGRECDRSRGRTLVARLWEFGWTKSAGNLFGGSFDDWFGVVSDHQRVEISDTSRRRTDFYFDRIILADAIGAYRCHCAFRKKIVVRTARTNFHGGRYYRRASVARSGGGGVHLRVVSSSAASLRWELSAGT